MKKPFIRLLLFMVLMLGLAAGLTYLSLNHISETKDKEDSKKMDVALVNEDEGTTFNRDNLDFGDAFVKSLDKNDDQEWYVVSRGVAENGLERGTYDMMIVIPNDFSQRALSMNDDAPEQVVLDYKINASDNDKVQAQAEDTASSILNDFNRRIIDVYFASVIGNLHDAQDNITELVEEEAEHTDTYNRSVNSTLSDYTDQFETVKDRSSASKDSFGSFEDMLDSFQEGLTDKVNSSEEYRSSVDDAEKLNEAIDELGVDFMDELNNYYDSMGGEDVDDQLQSLKKANNYIHSQFNEDDEDDELSSVAMDTKALKERLNQALQNVDEAQNQLENAIEEGLVDKEVEDELREIVEEAFDGQDDLSDLLNKQDEDVREKINDQISKLPTLNEDAIEHSDLSPETKQEIKNVIEVTEAYDEEFDDVKMDEKDVLSDHVSKLINELKDGVTVKDTVKIPENKKSGQEFELHDIPKAFKIEHLTLTMPDKEKMDFSGSDAEEVIPLPSNKEGDFEVELILQLKDDYDETLDGFDVYNEFTEWSWTLEQKDINNEMDEEEDSDTVSFHPTKSQLVASTTTDNDDEDSKNDKQDNADQSDDKNDDKNSDNESKDDSKNDSKDESKDDNNDSDNNSSEESTKKSDGDSGKKAEKKSKKDTKEKLEKDLDSKSKEDEDDKEPEIDEVYVVNNKIERQVTEPVIDESTQTLINAVENTISPYQKLLSTYETYFGFDLAKKLEIGDNDSLKEMATDDSLYHLFNETSVKELLADYILDVIEDEVKEAVNDPLKSLNKEVDEYRSFIKETDANAEELVEKISETKVETRNLNNNLEETLDDISDWRDKSSGLLDNQMEIQSKSGEEHTAVMSLGQEFEPLLSQSQSLADQSSSNLETADNVYRTFDRVDEQAESIQQSGTDLIIEADDLSNDMSNKLEDDQEFAENFQGVLDNSRIGGQQNEDLYDFLSSPVDTENKALIVKGDTFTPYFLVLIGFIVALFTGYVISTTDKRHTAEGQFETDRSLMGGNLLITGITAGIGILEGLIIGLLSAHYLGISQGSLLMWTGLIILMMLAMLFVTAYLLRQLKMIGMFILLAVMSMYLFLTRALGTGFAGSDQLRAYSPLQYLENMLTRAIQGDTNYQVIMFSVIALVVLGALANLLVWHKQGNVEDEQDAAQTHP